MRNEIFFRTARGVENKGDFPLLLYVVQLQFTQKKPIMKRVLRPVIFLNGFL